MHPNPFSPSFSIHPQHFYGRREYLDRFEKALATPGSADLFFFLTGTRGCGKTSLLHQYATLASREKWDVVEAASADVVDQLLHYVGLDKKGKRRVALSPSVAIAGASSVSLGTVETTYEDIRPPSLLGTELVKKLSKSVRGRGLVIVVDEAQKIKRDDIVAIGNAVQHMRTEGLPIALILGGLPSAYSKIRGYKDCTFLRRMRHEQLWCMPKGETIECLEGLFALVPEIGISEEQVWSIGQYSGGHPYLLQLVGDNVYRTIERTFEPLDGMCIEVSADIIEEAEKRALVDYRENVLADVLAGTHGSTRDYIDKAFELRDASGIVRVADINENYGKTSIDMAATRSYALGTQVVRKAGYGKLRFALPHFGALYEDVEVDEQDSKDDDWQF